VGVGVGRGVRGDADWPERVGRLLKSFELVLVKRLILLVLYEKGGGREGE